MDSLNALWDGFGVALSARGVLWGLAGVTLGTLSASCQASDRP